jgi:3-dehydroquinate dehydratase/shikimate dehydrogenase
MVQVEIQEAVKRGAQMIEVRLDFLAKAPDFNRILANKAVPLVATVRRPEDGGRWSGTEEARQMLLRQAIVSGFDWVDLETDVADTIRRFRDVRRIVSYHNLHEVPANLKEIHARMCQQDADIVKIAVRAQRPADNLQVLGLLENPPRPTVALGLGDLGMPSRILAARYGAPYTYAAFNKERNLALGLPTFDELLDVYHYPRLNADTQVYGVIGDPVGHSLSPLIHNRAFRALDVNAVYLPFRVPRGELAPFLAAFDKLPVLGYSVTIPHKEAAATAARRQAPAVLATHAANTLLRGPDGWTAHNTDVQAILDSLEASLGQRADGGPNQLGSMTVLVLGAGGVARAVAHALHKAGAVVVLSNRTAPRGEKLAEEVGCRSLDWSLRHTGTWDLVVNATSVGMHPNVDECPLEPGFLKEPMMVFDTVYTPETTLLIKQARERGCHTLTGVDMFVRQAALQFQLFTGREPPLELMRGVVRKALSPVAIRDEDAKPSAGPEKQ